MTLRAQHLITGAQGVAIGAGQGGSGQRVAKKSMSGPGLACKSQDVPSWALHPGWQMVHFQEKHKSQIRILLSLHTANLGLSWNQTTGKPNSQALLP